MSENAIFFKRIVCNMIAKLHNHLMSRAGYTTTHNLLRWCKYKSYNCVAAHWHAFHPRPWVYPHESEGQQNQRGRRALISLDQASELSHHRHQYQWWTKNAHCLQQSSTSQSQWSHQEWTSWDSSFPCTGWFNSGKDAKLILTYIMHHVWLSAKSANISITD